MFTLELLEFLFIFAAAMRQNRKSPVELLEESKPYSTGVVGVFPHFHWSYWSFSIFPMELSVL